jgi:hypothetical protein
MSTHETTSWAARRRSPHRAGSRPAYADVVADDVTAAVAVRAVPAESERRVRASAGASVRTEPTVPATTALAAATTAVTRLATGRRGNRGTGHHRSEDA